MTSPPTEKDDRPPGARTVEPLVPSQQRQARFLFMGLVLFYATALTLLASFGLFGFVWKTLVVPTLVLVATLAGRFKGFVRDWAVYLAAIVLFDSCRGLIYGLVVTMDLPVFMSYAADWERTAFGAILPAALQHAFAAVPPRPLVELAVVVHASHFLAFLVFSFLVWLVRPVAFSRFTLAMMVMMYLGLLCYLLAPTVPPWMAATRFHTIEPVARLAADVYNFSAPSLAKAFDTNPIAAMPSLHAAFPALMTMVAFTLFGRWGLVVLAYFTSVALAVIFLGEHYGVDVLAGVALAGASYALAYSRFGSRIEERREFEGARIWRLGSEARPIVIAVLLLVTAQVAGLGAVVLQRGVFPNESFVARELDGRSSTASFYRGLLAYRTRKFPDAQRWLEDAVRELPDATRRDQAITLLSDSASHNGDWPTVVEMLEGQATLTEEQRRILVAARRALDGADRH